MKPFCIRSFLFALGAICPTTGKSLRRFVYKLRDYDLDAPDDRFIEKSNIVAAQDKAIVEEQRPEELPVDLAEEMHVIANTEIARLLLDLGPEGTVADDDELDVLACRPHLLGRPHEVPVRLLPVEPPDRADDAGGLAHVTRARRGDALGRQPNAVRNDRELPRVRVLLVLDEPSHGVRVAEDSVREPIREPRGV